MSFGSNVTRKTPRAMPFVRLMCSGGDYNRLLPARDSWRVNTAHVSSFVLISILRGQRRTPPSDDNLGVLDYHINLLQILISITFNFLLFQKGKFTLHLVVLIDGLERKYLIITPQKPK